MMTLLIYLLKVSAVMAVLFGVYYLTLRHYTFHLTNRMCLIVVIVFSFIIPFIPVNSTFDGAVTTFAFENGTYSPEATVNPILTGNPTHSSMVYPFPFVVAVYVLGFMFFAYRFARSLISLFRLTQQCPVEERGGLRIRRTDADTSFTFLNTIFIPQGENDKMILHHERAHVRQLHWIDLMLTELVSIILWFNPIVFLLKREVRLQHEYLADRSVLTHGVRFEHYAQCLIRNMHSRMPVSSVSPLHSNTAKKRILMMTKRETSNYLFVTYLLMIPAIAAVLMSFGRRNMQAETVKSYTVESSTVHQNPDNAPVDLKKVTKIIMYGERIHPATQKLTMHTGIDFVLPAGSDVVATRDGIVIAQQYGEREGNYIVISHDNTYSTRYYHLQKALVKNGDKVTKGQVVGLVGSTGVLSTAPHLHYEVLKNGTPVDPKEHLPALPNL